MPQNDQAVPVSRNFKGVDRLTAPHLLDESFSPDSSDFAPATEINGLGGPRNGRKRLSNFSSTIRNALPYNFPNGKGRVVCDSTGLWTGIVQPWPTPT